MRDSDTPSRRLRLVEDDAPGRWRLRLIVIALWLASLGATYLVLRATIAPQYARVAQDLAQARRALAAGDAERSRLQQKLAQHQRGEQVAERAIQELQQALAARQEEIASLRSDLGFYQRLMEGGAQQPGVSVHSLVLRPTDDPRAFQFALTLSQNLKRNRKASGSVEINVSGAAGQDSARLGLADLGGTGSALEFSFKYFQQLAGMIMLPEGFKPASVRLRVQPEGSNAIEREFIWKDVVIEGDE